MTIEAFVKKRNEVLLSRDVDEVIAHAAQYGTYFKDRYIAEIAMHKAITAVTSFSAEEKAPSELWLLERGFKSLA